MANVTVVMSPRERFSATERAIEALFSDMSVPFDFICVDGGSPARVRDYLRRESDRRNFRLIRTEHYLTPNEARNLGAKHVTTPYLVFVDNDLVVAPGWLGLLLRCAEETGAEIVSPLTCIGEPLHTRVHMAGGDARITEENGQLIFREKHRFLDRPVAEVRDQLVREPCDLVEFHCMLTRKSVFDRFGPLDENLKTIYEHVDYCLAVRQAGGTVMHEPNACVTYVIGPRLTFSDLRYFCFRWNAEWSADSERHFHAKWGTVYSDRVAGDYVAKHRHRPWWRLRSRMLGIVGWRITEFLLGSFSALLSRWGRRSRERLHAPPPGKAPMRLSPHGIDDAVRQP
jgi:GT2 family glycosyltransferase